MGLSSPRNINVLSMVLLNILAVTNVMNLTFAAQLGPPLFLYHGLAVLTFFIPCAFTAAELNQHFPNQGLYGWAKAAFGPGAAVMVAWSQWLYNVCWFPTVFSFLAVNFYTLLGVTLGQDHRWWITGTSILLYWITSFSSGNLVAFERFSVWSAILGTVMPILILMGFGLMMPTPSLQMIWSTPLVQDGVSLGRLWFGLMGIEMSALYAQHLPHPRRHYVRALLYASVIIIVGFALSAWAISNTVPAEELSLVGGLFKAYALLLEKIHCQALWPILGLFTLLGVLGSANAWILSAAKYLFAAIQDGWFFQNAEQEGEIPHLVLRLQGILVTFLILSTGFIPSLETAFRMLSQASTQLALIGYLFMFAALFRLHRSIPVSAPPEGKSRIFSIFTAQSGMIVINSLGLMSTACMLLLSFISSAGYWTVHIMLFSGLLLTPYVWQFFLRQEN